MKAFKPSRDGALAVANVVLRIDPATRSVTMSPEEYNFMQALGGAMVWSLQDELPPPNSGGALDRFNSAPSQWAKWHPGFFTGEEQGALLALHPEWEAAIHQHINWFDGQGGYKLQGNRHPDGSYWYLVPKTGPDPAGYYGTEEKPDINGAADARIVELFGKIIEPLG